MRFPIRYQFMAPLAAVAIASLMTIALVNHRLATQQTRDRVQTQLQGVVSVLTQRAYPLTEQVLLQMAGLSNAQFVLTDTEGTPITSSGPSDEWGVLPSDTPMAKLPSDVVLGDPLTIGESRFFHSSVWVHPSAIGDPGGVLHILFPQEDYNAAWRAAFLPPLVVGLATVAALAAVICVVAARVSKVLSNLGQEVTRLAQGDFSDVRQPSLHDETRDLAESINQTALRLRDYENELKRNERVQTVAMIGAGLAHEMRNAATGCRLAIDLHAEFCDAAHDESLDVARRQLVHMEHRLKQLLQFGKPSKASRPHQVDLTRVVEQCIDLLAPAARHKGVIIEWSPPPLETTVTGDQESIAQVVTNLLWNALDAAAKRNATARHEDLAGGAGAVSVAIETRGAVALLHVIDNGAGPATTEDLFEPFVTDKLEGVGLGLAVARRIIDALNGAIEYRRDEDRTVFCVSLPTTHAHNTPTHQT